jgi:hypothetical protein
MGYPRQSHRRLCGMIQALGASAPGAQRSPMLRLLM